ncbi:NUDIX domain-containing protein [Solimonas aquatica]|uniref:NUDIX domain-containing protein n=1 Tax=Solimonas aquatica TaxID=489703 RepID=A0A1H9H4Z5_9GAMM|nr:NUDIX hydrolase [Solimonas aquatica]SEQ57402.1 NUDIX domain-containing protein [Solimonas aquatica]
MYPEILHCNACGQRVEFRTPDGDHLPRHVCPACGHIQYRNPKVIVGVIPEASDGRILLCRRNIEPRLGLWTFPAGFMEMGETSGQGAAREALEESQADVEVDELLMMINVPYVSQIYLIHRGRMRSDHHGPTFESSETKLLREEEVPWDQIAFPTIWHSLKRYFEDRRAGVWRIHTLDLAYRPRPPERAEVSRGEPEGG